MVGLGEERIRLGFGKLNKKKEISYAAAYRKDKSHDEHEFINQSK